MPSADTESEQLFARFCAENGVSYRRVPETSTRTPDFELVLKGHLVIAEIKQLEPNLDERDASSQLIQDEPAGYWTNSVRRVQNKMRDAKKQIKHRAKESLPTILVLHDCVSWGVIDATDIKTAMYGHDTVTVSEVTSGELEISDHSFGGDRFCTPHDNTSFSSFGLLAAEIGRLSLSVFHNFYAKHPLDPDWLRSESVRHFTLDPSARGHIPPWRLV